MLRTCKLDGCDDPIPDNAHRKVEYCSDMCRRVARRKRWHRRYGAAHGTGTCENCGAEYEKHIGTQRFCSAKCKDTHGFQQLGNTIECDCCGGDLVRTSAGKRMHSRWCASDGRIIGCASCGQDKSYDEYYDYRDRGGKFLPTCKECLSRKSAVKRWKSKGMYFI